jgi:hypothetical protein
VSTPFSIVAVVSWACDALGIKMARKRRIISVGREITAIDGSLGWS